MIVLDSSVLIALALEETDAPALLAAIDANDVSHLSTCTLVETSIVLEGRKGALGRVVLDQVLQSIRPLSIVAFDEAQAALAREAFRRFGKGRHPARLNLGDCFAYALAKSLDAPLLFKGNDFSKTDVKRV